MYLKNEKGFTLIELIVGIVIVSLFMLGTFIFQHNMQTFSRQGTTKTELQREGTLALEYMIRDIREAMSVNIDDSPEGGVENRIIVSTPYQIITYWSVEDNTVPTREDNLYMDRGSGEEILVGDYSEGGFGIKVDDLTFTDNYPTSNIVDINLSLKLLDLKVNPAVELGESMVFSAQVQPRNRS